MKCNLCNNREIVWSKTEGELDNEMQKLSKCEHSDLVVVSGIAVNQMKLFNIDSDEDTEDIDVPSIKTVNMGICRYRCEVETDGVVDPL